MKSVAIAIAVGLVFAASAPAKAAQDEPVRRSGWAAGPTRADVLVAWPETAKTHHLSGHGILDCVVEGEGELRDCIVSEEGPPGFGFGSAALSLAAKIRLPAESGQQPPKKRKIEVSFDDDEDRPVDRAADWLKRPSASELLAFWPAGGAEGEAIIKCTATTTGALKDCKALWEKPQGKGFGTAALLLAPSFLMKPAMKDGHPVESYVQIPVNWVGGEQMLRGPTYRMVTTLPWIAAPSSADVAKAYPPDALSKGLTGHVVLRCGVSRRGMLQECAIASSEPRYAGFSDSALALSKLFRTEVGGLSNSVIATIRINLAFQFTPPEAIASPRMLTQFDWTRELNPDAMLAAFPAKAADAGLTTGRVVVDCTVAQNGNLTNCAPISEDPAGMEFGAAAIQIAQALAVNPWTSDGLPADGAHLKFALRFLHKEPEPASAPQASVPPQH